MKPLNLKYLVVGPNDRLWGTTVNSVGSQIILPGESYPPGNHPTRYLFTEERGRILDEYQLLYITEGSGRFRSTTVPQFQTIGQGDLFMLFPGEWHTYRPEETTGWKEYWIGFNSEQMETLVNNDFFSPSKPIWKTGLHSDMVRLYEDAIEVARQQESGFQQRLAGIVQYLLSLAWFYGRNADLSEVAKQISKAKILIGNQLGTIRPEELANQLHMSYSNFRRVFKSYTALSPAKFIQQVRIDKAKELLTNSNKPIKQIAFETGYENDEYFYTLFKRIVCMTPHDYRLFTQGRLPAGRKS